MIDVDQAIKEALKHKDEIALKAYRALKSKIMVKQTEAGRETGKPVDEQEFLTLLRKEIKEREESNEYLPADNPDRKLNERIIAKLSEHLPRQPSAEELDALVARTIEQTGAAGPKDMGKVMSALRQADPNLDMGAASARVKARLQQMAQG